MSLDLDGLGIRHPDGNALIDDLNLSVAPGTVTTLTGPSGVGKSTLLNAVGGHLEAGFRLRGRVVLNGRDLSLIHI